MSEKACNYCVREFWAVIFVKANGCVSYIETLPDSPASYIETLPED